MFILDDPTVNGFALPGGYIFITRGALAMCADESEAAAIIAHEMAHVIRKHGVQELSKRKVHIKADDAFAELEEETGEKSADEAELDDLVHKTYENIVAPRLFAYELEADRLRNRAACQGRLRSLRPGPHQPESPRGSRKRNPASSIPATCRRTI